jgi:hypothetical protein
VFEIETLKQIPFALKHTVMAGLSRPKDGVDSLARSRPKDGVASLAYVPAIHVLLWCQGVDARDKRGHDGGDWGNLCGRCSSKFLKIAWRLQRRLPANQNKTNREVMPCDAAMC